MLLTIDIGNTSIAAAVFDGDALTARFRLASDREMDAEACGSHIAAQLRAGGVDPGAIEGAVLSSTVPVLAAAAAGACRAIFGVEPVVVSAETQAGVPLRYDDPSKVGPDRILHAVAAVHRHTPPVIVVDFGTALVFDAVGRDGAYLGGTIAPGIGISARALFDGAAMLDDVEVTAPPSGSVIGRNTVDGMQAGMFYGYVEMVRGMVRRFKEEIGDDATVIATGGYANEIAAASGCVDAIEPDLNFEALRLVYEANT
ncbi:MAG: type III pantothenate kinase [Chloroflexi bacterium]|nr:type III pantothenate kinase [Chloroflexota bacterium]MYD66100.1 type III pantothenate kinase [Chloroflexota bacterium]